jgi:hypothetical protein
MQGAGEQKEALQLRERAVAMTRNSTRNKSVAPEEIGPPLVSLAYADVCSRMLTSAHACSRMLTYADVC